MHLQTNLCLRFLHITIKSFKLCFSEEIFTPVTWHTSKTSGCTWRWENSAWYISDTHTLRVLVLSEQTRSDGRRCVCQSLCLMMRYSLTLHWTPSPESPVDGFGIKLSKGNEAAASAIDYWDKGTTHVYRGIAFRSVPLKRGPVYFSLLSREIPRSTKRRQSPTFHVYSGSFVN